jgi:flagellar biosynthesis protein FlhB
VSDAPSPKRLREARALGELATSPLLTSAGAVAGAAAGWWLSDAQGIANFARTAFGAAAMPTHRLADASWLFVQLGGRVLVGAFLGALAVGLLQTRGLFSVGALRTRAPSSPRAIGFVGWGTALVGLVAVAQTLRPLLFQLGRVTDGPATLSATGPALRTLAWRLFGVLLLGGIVELIVERGALFRKLRMTRAERAAEAREAEGDPQLRAEARRRQREP